MAMDHHHPVTNSEVYLLNSSHAPSNPPPSPPSPSSPCERALTPPPVDLLSVSPPEPIESGATFDQRLSNAVHVLRTEATALSCLTRFYETDSFARASFNAAISTITRSHCKKGKLILIGVGKSGYICKKLVATLKSLKIPAEFMHPTEALHGDLGTTIGDEENNTILMITFSGSTPELVNLLPHLDPKTPLLIMSRHTHPTSCKIIELRPGSILLPTPIHTSEMDSFGVNAPTTSTTLCMALGDALAMVIAKQIHPDVKAVFSRNHPGGAIGAAFRGPQKFSDLAIEYSEIDGIGERATGANVLMAAYKSKTQWVKQGDDFVVPPRRIKRLQADHLEEPAECIQGLMVPQREWILLPAEMEISKAQKMIRALRSSGGSSRYEDDGILAMMNGDEICGVLEIEGLMMA